MRRLALLGLGTAAATTLIAACGEHQKTRPSQPPSGRPPGLAAALPTAPINLDRSAGAVAGRLGAGTHCAGRRAGDPREQGPERLGALSDRSLRRRRLLGTGRRSAIRGRRQRPLRRPGASHRRPGARCPAAVHRRHEIRCRRTAAANAGPESWPWWDSASAEDWCGNCWAPLNRNCPPRFRSTGRCPTTPTSAVPKRRCWRSTRPATPASPASQSAARAALHRAGLVNEVIVEPDADHAFFNDTGPRYNAAAADDAWRRVLDWLGRYLA